MTAKPDIAVPALPMSLTRAFVRQRLAAPRPPSPRGDAATALRLMKESNLKAADVPFPAAIPRGRDGAFIPAAVLVLLVEHEAGFSVLFTQRTAELKAHGGQISFPGGRTEPGDADANAAALRETFEEVGIPATQIELLGHLDSYVTVTGYDVTPVVGAVKPPLSLKPDPMEVAEIFEVPLAFFLDPARHERHTRLLPDGTPRAYYAMPYGDRYIWGATAGMLVNLYEVLTA